MSSVLLHNFEIRSVVTVIMVVLTCQSVLCICIFIFMRVWKKDVISATVWMFLFKTCLTATQYPLWWLWKVNTATLEDACTCKTQSNQENQFFNMTAQENTTSITNRNVSWGRCICCNSLWSLKWVSTDFDIGKKEAKKSRDFCVTLTMYSRYIVRWDNVLQDIGATWRHSTVQYNTREKNTKIVDSVLCVDGY